MLQNAYFLAKIGADTAENEQHFAEILPKIRNYPTGPRGFPERRGPAASLASSGTLRPPAGARSVAPMGRGVARRVARSALEAFFENTFFENAFFENFANFWRARSRLYQDENLQENMRSTAFFKLYKICILLHRCNLKFSQKIGLKKQQFS